MTKEQATQTASPAKQEPKKKVERGLVVFGILNLLAGVLSLATYVYLVPAIYEGVSNGTIHQLSSTTVILLFVHVVVSFASAAMFVLLGIRLMKGNRRKAGLQTNIMIVLAILELLTCIAIVGVKAGAYIEFFVLLYLCVLHVKIEPGLREERQRDYDKLLEETRKEQEAGTLGRDKTGKGYMRLDFFNVFWIFVIGCLLGVLVETVYCYIVNGVLENRTGLLWGWWSPIYGFGGVFISIALNRFYKSNIIVIFLVSMLIGAGTEYFVSWFFDTAFGIKAWDYSANFMNLNGRTDITHACMFGILGCVWVKWLQAPFLKFINAINWKWRYTVTTLFALFMIANGAMTLLAIDSWVSRVNGTSTDTPIEQFFAENYPNDWMKNHFQTMGIQRDVSKDKL